MAWIYSATEPEQVEVKKHLGMKQRTVNYAVEPLAEQTAGGHRFRHKSVTLEPGVWGYDAIVSALVNAEYSHDRMDAIVNNYLDDQANPEHLQEMEQMQSWRRAAKELARSIMDEPLK